MFRRLMSSRSLLAELEEQSVGLLGNSNMEARAEHQKVKQYQTLYTFTTCIGVGVCILMLVWVLHFRQGLAWQSQPSLEFNWHPLLMCIGMIFCYSQAILLYRTGRNYQKKNLKILHAILNCLAFILAVIALKAVFDSHNLQNTPNLYTLHSWIGLATVIIFAAQFLAGFLTFLYPGLSPTLRTTILPIHVIFGTSCFIGVIVASVSGLLEKAIWAVKDYQNYGTEGIYINIIGTFIILYGILVLYLVNNVDYKRVALADDQMPLERSE
ncbi:unnamed protein product [Diabrotica balteata]|uniref:Cytochrome b561 domain-containing protein n=1 Tax=Diabrotica balteata TaxID=107213 RepID=A0A9N9XAD1_DIABA|nr:unnamed protein product [Diabrotica balteata]